MTQPCPGCQARHFDPGAHFPTWGLCAYCLADEATRSERRIELRTLRPPPPRPLAPYPTKHKPGTTGKEGVLAWRLECGYDLHHPDDSAVDDPEAQDADPDPTPDPIHPEDLLPGVELDMSKGRVAYRARPRWRDCRVKLGRFAGYAEAADAVRAFFAERWGQWDDARPWLRQSACLAVVRLATGWHDLEFPPGVPAALARRAAAVVLRGEPWESWWAAEAALRQEIDRCGPPGGDHRKRQGRL